MRVHRSWQPGIDMRGYEHVEYENDECKASRLVNALSGQAAQQCDRHLHGPVCACMGVAGRLRGLVWCRLFCGWVGGLGDSICEHIVFSH